MNDHTFVISAYKHSPYLENCIQSLLSQTVKSNIILSTSTPSVFIETIAKKYSIPLYTHSGDGISNDWNAALQNVETEYGTIAHQDDIYLPEYWQSCKDAAQNKKNALIIFTDYQELVGDREVSENQNLNIKRQMLLPIHVFPSSRFVRRRVLSLGSPICCPAVTYHWSALKSSSFCFDSSMTVSLDWDAWERISRLKGDFCYIPRPLMQHRIHDESETTNAIGDNRRSDEDLAMFRRFWGKRMALFLFSKYIKSQNSNQIIANGRKENIL